MYSSTNLAVGAGSFRNNGEVCMAIGKKTTIALRIFPSYKTMVCAMLGTVPTRPIDVEDQTGRDQKLILTQVKCVEGEISVFDVQGSIRLSRTKKMFDQAGAEAFRLRKFHARLAYKAAGCEGVLAVD